MKIFKLIASVIVLFWILIACEPPVVFTGPQPMDVAVENKIPEAYRGIFWCGTDSITLMINDKEIYKRKDLRTAISRQEIDANTELALSGNQLYIKGLDEYFPATIRNDTVYSSLLIKDTILDMDNPLHVLKYHKGHLVINNRLKDSFWEVKLITLQPDGKLILSKVNYPENLAVLDSVTEVTRTDGTMREQVVVSPSKAEFNHILDKKLIFDGACQEFVPIVSVDTKKKK